MKMAGSIEFQLKLKKSPFIFVNEFAINVIINNNVTFLTLGRPSYLLQQISPRGGGSFGPPPPPIDFPNGCR